MDDEKVVAIALAVYAMQKLKAKKKRRKRTIWVKPYLRDRHGKSNFQLVHDLRMRLQDKEEYRAYLRMDTQSFSVSRSSIIAMFGTQVNSPCVILGARNNAQTSETCFFQRI